MIVTREAVAATPFFKQLQKLVAAGDDGVSIDDLTLNEGEVMFGMTRAELASWEEVGTARGDDPLEPPEPTHAVYATGQGRTILAALQQSAGHAALQYMAERYWLAVNGEHEACQYPDECPFWVGGQCDGGMAHGTCIEAMVAAADAATGTEPPEDTRLQPGQVPVGEADLRWLVVREAESGNGGCYETCPARARCPVDEGDNAVITSGCCRAMLLAHLGLAANANNEALSAAGHLDVARLPEGESLDEQA